MTLQIWLLIGLVALGGLGSVARFLLSRWQGFLPWGILTANVVASMLFGFCLSAQSTAQASPFLNYLMPIVATGFAGGLSTFSSWAAQTAGLITAKQGRAAMLNTVLNLVLPVVAVIAGMNLSPILLK